MENKLTDEQKNELIIKFLNDSVDDYKKAQLGDKEALQRLREKEAELEKQIPNFYPKYF